LISRESIDEVLRTPQRKLIVAENDIDLVTNMSNDIFILMVEESHGSAGGRAGGSGSRRIDRILGFSYKGGICVKSFEVSEPEKIELFNIPYSAVAMDIKLSTGEPIVVQGVVDPGLVEAYKAIAKN
jgi:hypothetical protein